MLCTFQYIHNEMIESYFLMSKTDKMNFSIILAFDFLFELNELKTVSL